MTVDGERSRYFGPDASYESRGNGATFNNLDSDFFFQRIKDDQVVEKLLEQPPPSGPLPRDPRGRRAATSAGYNALPGRRRRATGITDPRCRGKAWVRPITELDAFRRFYQLTLLASQGSRSTASRRRSRRRRRAGSRRRRCRRRRPRTGSPRPAAARRPRLQRRRARHATATQRRQAGCCSATRTSPGTAPSASTRRSSRSPAKSTSPGGSLFGVPLVLIGHTQTWPGATRSRPRSASRRSSSTLVPGSPTTYLVDGQPREMTRDGRSRCQARKARRLARAAHAHALLDRATARCSRRCSACRCSRGRRRRRYAMGDANANNFRLSTTSSRSTGRSATAQLDAIERRYQGIPWVNTIAADSTRLGLLRRHRHGPARDRRGGRSAATRPRSAPRPSPLLGLPVLDGSRSACDWGSDPTRSSPGSSGRRGCRRCSATTT